MNEGAEERRDGGTTRVDGRYDRLAEGGDGFDDGDRLIDGGVDLEDGRLNERDDDRDDDRLVEGADDLDLDDRFDEAAGERDGGRLILRLALPLLLLPPPRLALRALLLRFPFPCFFWAESSRVGPHKNAKTVIQTNSFFIISILG